MTIKSNELADDIMDYIEKQYLARQGVLRDDLVRLIDNAKAEDSKIIAKVDTGKWALVERWAFSDFQLGSLTKFKELYEADPTPMIAPDYSVDPVGTVREFKVSKLDIMSPEESNKWIRCNGRLLRATEFPELAKAIPERVCNHGSHIELPRIDPCWIKVR